MTNDLFELNKKSSLKLKIFNNKLISLKKKKKKKIKIHYEKKIEKKISSFIFFFKESFFKYKYLKIQKKFLKALTKFFPVFFLKWKVDIYLPKIFSKSFSLNFGLFSFLKNLKKKKKNMFSFELFSLFLKKQLSKKLKEKTKNQNENFIRLDIFFPKESDLSHYLNKIKKYFK